MPESQKTALLSVSDKSGIVDFAFELARLGWRIVSAGGTAATLRQSELAITELQDFLQAPELLGGGLRLAHPKLLAALLADRDSPGAMHELERLGVAPVDLVALNLYPLSEALQDSSLSPKEILDLVDVAACSALRAAARNHGRVVTLTDPGDYPRILESLKELGEVGVEARQALAAKAFHYTAYYDSTVAQFLGSAAPRLERLPDEMVVGLKKAVDLRYGENPHQQAALYRWSGARPWGLVAAQLAHGRPLNYEHYLSLEVAAELVAEFSEPACAVVKHMNPAGAAAAHSTAEAARLAWTSDPAGCAGGVAAFNRELDEEAARALQAAALECVLAPEFSPAALDVLRSKKDLRLLTLPSLLLSPRELDLRAVSGGLLLQDKDNQTLPQEPRVVSRRPPDEVEGHALRFAWRVAKHAKTHAAVLCRGAATIGIGCGQAARMDALRLALAKSQERHPILPPSLPVVLATDSALSLRHVLEAAEAGTSAVIQPGGSSEDAEAVKACDAKGMAMLFAGIRHHRH